MRKFTFVVLHGWGLSSARFSVLSATLRGKGHSVFVPDFPGFGKAAQPASPYRLSDYVTFLRTYIKDNHIERPCIIGHSFGGRVALKYTYLYPDDVSALILTGTPGVTPVSRKKIYLFVKGAKIGKLLFSLWPLSIIKETVRSWYYFIAGAREYSRATGIMRDTFKNIVEEDLTVYMKTVRVPCGLIWGENDRITPLWIAYRMNGMMNKSSVYTIPGADHGVSYKKPEQFVRTVENFLKSV